MLFTFLQRIKQQSSDSKLNIAIWLFFSALLSGKSERLISLQLGRLKMCADDPKCSSLDRAQAHCILADYYLRKGLFQKVIEHGNQLANTELAMLFTYHPIQVVGMREYPAVEGERIPCQLLGKYFVLKAHRTAYLTSSAAYRELYTKEGAELLALLDVEPWTGYKANEIRQYARKCMNQPSLSLATSSTPVEKPTSQSRGRRRQAVLRK